MFSFQEIFKYLVSPLYTGEMDIHITYETLFDILRKERSRDELQLLDKLFWRHVVDYLKDKSDGSNSYAEAEKMRLQLQNIKRIIKEVYERRERKIMNLAVNTIRSDDSAFVDTQNMLLEEKKLFEETLSLLNKYKQGILLQVFNNQLPTIIDNEEYVNATFDDSSKNDDGLEESKLPPSVEEDEGQMDVDNVRVRFLSNVPKFVGKQKETYGPYDIGMEVNLPNQIAQILLRKGRAEEIE